MRNTLRLIAGIIAVFYVVLSFFGDSASTELFGIEMNIWTFRIIWSLLAAIILYSYFQKKSANK